jgi:hypothetical protein
MSGRITDDERERMHKFASTPKYERGPEMLVPESADEREAE